MFGWRCQACGEVRWSMIGHPVRSKTMVCPVCGAQMVEERRHPGRAGARSAKERRSRPLTPS